MFPPDDARGTTGMETRNPHVETIPESWLDELRFPEPVFVTSPSLVPLDAYREMLDRIWESKRLANNGPFHRELERRLAERLEAEHLSLFCNGTIALLVAMQALRIDGGEVITTPFTFPATAHVLYWNKVRPVFCDIDPVTFNLDPDRIEELVGPETKAILPVHVYGTPCDVDRIQAIAERHGLHVVYDAAHAFGVRRNGRSLVTHGDMSVLSFHATKLFTTAEGGAIVAGSAAQKQRIDFLKNFGIADEETVIGPGINGKMNELQAAYGLLQLDTVDAEIASRRVVAETYREVLAGVPGIETRDDVEGVEHNYAYFPVLVDPGAYGRTRDGLHAALKEFNVFARKYFHPLCSSYPTYASLPSSRPENLPVAGRVAERILCLPIFGDLGPETARTIGAIVGRLARSG